MDPRNFYRRVYLPAVRDVGLDGISWHTLRHTFASRLAMNGAGDSTIAALLRHSGTALVRRYAHLSPSHLQTAIEGVGAFGRGSPPQLEPGQKPEKRLDLRSKHPYKCLPLLVAVEGIEPPTRGL